MNLTGWKAVRKLAGFQWRREWPGLVFTLVFALYVGWLAGMLHGDAAKDRETEMPLSLAVDWLYLLMFPAFGQCMNRTSFRIMREDTHTRQIAYWLTMPIPLQVIVQARLLRSALFVPGFGLLFSFLQYAFAPELRAMLGPGEWLAFSWLWICYGLIVNALLVWLEMGMSGKGYMWTYWGIMAASGLAVAGTALAGVAIVGGTIDRIAAGHYELLLLSTLLAAAAFAAGYRLTLRRMRHRSYHL